MMKIKKEKRRAIVSADGSKKRPKRGEKNDLGEPRSIPVGGGLRGPSMKGGITGARKKGGVEKKALEIEVRGERLLKGMGVP